MITKTKLKNLIAMLREQGVTRYKGTWCGEEIELDLRDQPDAENASEALTSLPVFPNQTTREQIVREYEKELF